MVSIVKILCVEVEIIIVKYVSCQSTVTLVSQHGKPFTQSPSHSLPRDGNLKILLKRGVSGKATLSH